MIPVNGSISANPLDVVTNLQDNDAISKITAKYIKIPDTSKIGLTDAKVELSDQNGNKSEVTVPVFVHDHHSIFDDQYVLSSQNFTLPILTTFLLQKLKNGFCKKANLKRGNFQVEMKYLSKLK